MTLKDLLEVEESFWRSSGDADFYRRKVADDGRIVLSMGVMDKDAVVAAMTDAEPWEHFDIHEPSVVVITDEVSALTYRGTGRRDGEGDDYEANILSVYRRRNGEWQLVLHQQTPVAA